MTKLLHCLVIGSKLYIVVSFHQESDLGKAIVRLFKPLGGGGSVYIDYSGINSNWIKFFQIVFVLYLIHVLIGLR